MRNHFPREKYARRSLIETVFSVAKRKLSCRAPGRCLLTQRRQALLLGLTYNLYRFVARVVAPQDVNRANPSQETGTKHD
jgi:hypothetical protein